MFTHSMETIYLSLRAQVTVGTFSWNPWYRFNWICVFLYFVLFQAKLVKWNVPQFTITLGKYPRNGNRDGYLTKVWLSILLVVKNLNKTFMAKMISFFVLKKEKIWFGIHVYSYLKLILILYTFNIDTEWCIVLILIVT